MHKSNRIPGTKTYKTTLLLNYQVIKILKEHGFNISQIVDAFLKEKILKNSYLLNDYKQLYAQS